MKHAPTPYRVEDFADGWFLYSHDEGRIGSAHNKATAEFIARACNAHKELLALGTKLTQAVSQSLIRHNTPETRKRLSDTRDAFVVAMCNAEEPDA